MSRRFGKRPAKWLELPSTKKHIATLARALGKSNVRNRTLG
ncbi:hypothetical protein [Halomonas sp. WWR20]